MYPINTYHPSAPPLDQGQAPPPYDSFDKHLYQIELPGSDGTGPQCSTSSVPQYTNIPGSYGGMAYYNPGMVPGGSPPPMMVPPPSMPTVIPMAMPPHHPLVIGSMSARGGNITIPMMNAQNKQVVAVVPRYGGAVHFMTPEAYRRRNLIIFIMFIIFVSIVGVSFWLCMNNKTGPNIMAPVIFGEFLGFTIIAGSVSFCYKTSTDPNNPTK